MVPKFDHSEYEPSLEGPRAALPILFPESLPRSLLDVGCGRGAWINAALEAGVADVLGLDCVDLSADQLLFPPQQFRHEDLSGQVNLGRKFDVAICLEVAEHLPEKDSRSLISTLVNHADLVLFSAACPGQPGQFHINCQWPAYWQQLFNREGYVCDDAVRWKLWDLTALEYWYRQNLFLAQRAPKQAGHEPRIRPVVHPEMLALGDGTPLGDRRSGWLRQVEDGSQSVTWYLSTPARAFGRKLGRKLKTR